MSGKRQTSGQSIGCLRRSYSDDQIFTANFEVSYCGLNMSQPYQTIYF
jgi:hypothetical protein